MKRLELRVPPLVVLVLVLTVYAGLDVWIGTHPLGRWPIVSRSLVIAGCMVALVGVFAFRRMQTTVDPRIPTATSRLVTAGVYGRTRNPMYVGMTLVIVGGMAWCPEWFALLLAGGFVVYLTYFQIIPEERAIEAHFGEAYRTYKSKVRRWL